MYVNLRFRWTGEGYPGEDLTFTISGEDFCNNQEEETMLSVASAVNKYIQSTGDSN